MEALSEKEFKEYVWKKAKEYIFETDKAEEKHSMNEGVTPESVKKLVMDLKNINASLSFNDPLIDKVKEDASEPINESAEPTRRLKVGSYENPSIEVKENMLETMKHYNRSKSLTHGKDDGVKSWVRLTEYKKYDGED